MSQANPDYENRRKNKRIAVNIPAHVHLKDKNASPLDAEILDISEGGAFVHCAAPIAIGEEVLVEIKFAETKMLQAKVIDYEEWIRTHLPEEVPEKSVIKWARGSSNTGFGIEFVDLRPDKRAFLSRLVQYYENLNRAGVSFSK